MEEAEAGAAAGASSLNAASASGQHHQEDEVRRLLDENKALREALTDLAASFMPEELREGEPN